MMQSESLRSVQSEKQPACINRGDVDNQLGLLFDCLNNRVNLPKPETTALTFERHPKIPDVLISYDVIPYDLAKRCLDFIKSVPFDSNAKLINDDNNLPRNICYYYPRKLICNEYNCRYESPNEFTWEYYKLHMYRLVPITLRAFYGSPLIELINILLYRWWLSTEINVKNLIYGTIVIQKMGLGGSIPVHNDEWRGRRVAFIYYLTDEDWNDEDGGYLGVADWPENNTQKYIQIPPKFNTMVSWKMQEFKSPLHWVSEIKSNKARYALVGFWGDKSDILGLN